LLNLDPGFHSQLWIIPQCGSSNYYELKEMEKKKKKKHSKITKHPNLVTRLPMIYFFGGQICDIVAIIHRKI
jgi:hypothetical protein